MENKNISKQNCGCSDGCCTPPKKKYNLGKKIIFAVIILAAAAIITVKLVNKPAECCSATETCCPQ
jgi:hypothetical protein